MAALIGLEFDAAEAVAAEAAQGEVCQAANDNGGGQVVVSGNKAAVERAVEIAKAKGAKRAMLLPVSAPFHCALMQPASAVMAEARITSYNVCYTKLLRQDRPQQGLFRLDIVRRGTILRGRLFDRLASD